MKYMVLAMRCLAYICAVITVSHTLRVQVARNRAIAHLPNRNASVGTFNQEACRLGLSWG